MSRFAWDLATRGLEEVLLCARLIVLFPVSVLSLRARTLLGLQDMGCSSLCFYP